MPLMNTAFLALLRGAMCAAALATFSATAQAPSDLRVALVIGNAAYATAPLRNPANDAKAMSAALRSLGFRVIEVNDASKAQMEHAIAQARDALTGKGGVGILYYAGHGLQLDWRNYMVPVDAKLATAADVLPQTVDVQHVVDAFKAAGNRMNIVVLDACRDNPFAATTGGKGLAPLDAPPGTFLAYATAPGNVAEDGSSQSGNGLYTGYLVSELKRPGAKIEDVFKRVRFQVRKQSEGRQVPWESTSLEEDFYFDSGNKLAAQAARQAQDAFAAEKGDWDRIKDSTNADDFYAYLQRYPNGLISEKAQFQLEQLQRARIVPQPAAGGIAVLPASQARYRVGDRFVYREADFYGLEREPRDLRVTKIEGGMVVLNDGFEVWDLMGNLVTDFGGTRSPAKIWFPTELALGKRWRSAYTISHARGSSSLYWDFVVTALEEVPVPAGVFRAFRVEGTSRVSNGRYQTETFWIDPTDFLMIKDIFTSRGPGIVPSSYRRELALVERARPGT